MSSVKDRIAYLEDKLKKSSNPVERTEISEKIKKLKEGEAKEIEKEINTQIDAPSVIDHEENRTVLTRGQIMNAGDTFIVGI